MLLQELVEDMAARPPKVPLKVRLRFSLARRRLEHDFFFMLAFVNALASSLPSLEELFRHLSEIENPYMVRVFRRIRVLATAMNYGFLTAIEAVTLELPSSVLRDFLVRMAHALRAGELLRFLRVEREAYTITYRGAYSKALKNLENMSMVFSSLVVASTYIAITTILTSMIFFVGSETELLIGSILGVLGTMLMAVVIIIVVVPPDVFTCTRSGGVRPLDVDRLKPLALAAITAAAALVLVGLFQLQLPYEYLFILGGLPLIPVGMVAKRVDGRIRAREAFFPTFIRALGTAAGSTSGTMLASLRLVTRKNFGELTPLVRRLHARLAVGVNPEYCWKAFESECGSELIRVFTEIYRKAVFVGSDPKAVGRLAANLVLKTLVLRAKRAQVANSFKTTVYVLHTVEVAILSFIASVMGFWSGRVLGLANIGFEMEILSTNPELAPLLTLTTLGVALALSFANAVAIKYFEVANRYTFLLHLGLLLVVAGISLSGVSLLTSGLFSAFNLEVAPLP
jgi:flagellar protein FlaJ